tara:strand:+ start:29113 stop:29610 length:498 start_codon:yes stop_codon:yes gene_type:complete
MDLSKLIALASKIDQLDYYQVLGLQREADMRDIRAAYHKRARAIHPDLFYEHPNEEFRFAIDKIFKRVAEAYVILRDSEKRKFYDKGLDGENKRLRYTDVDEQAMREEKRHASGKTLQGRKYYKEAVRLHEEGNLKKAIQTLKMAIGFESDNESFREVLEQWTEE